MAHCEVPVPKGGRVFPGARNHCRRHWLIGGAGKGSPWSHIHLMLLLQSFPLRGLRLCSSPPGPHIASLSTIGFSRREELTGLLPKSLNHPKSGKPSILSCLKISWSSWSCVSCPSHELGPSAPFHPDRPRPSQLDMSRFIRDCDPRLIRIESHDSSHSKETLLLSIIL